MGLEWVVVLTDLVETNKAQRSICLGWTQGYSSLWLWHIFVIFRIELYIVYIAWIKLHWSVRGRAYTAPIGSVSVRGRSDIVSRMVISPSSGRRRSDRIGVGTRSVWYRLWYKVTPVRPTGQLGRPEMIHKFLWCHQNLFIRSLEME